MYIDDSDAEGNDQQAWYRTWDDGELGNYGTLIIQSATNTDTSYASCKEAENRLENIIAISITP